MDPTLVAMRTKQQVAKYCPPGAIGPRMTMHEDDMGTIVLYLAYGT